MTCPKCGGDMRTYERNGVDIDQCTECRGIFLDRGELERLTDAESRYYGGERAPSESPRGSSGHHGGGHREEGQRGRRKEGFFGDLFG